MRDINLFFCSNKPDIAAYAVACGVDRVFVDLETIGKQERQMASNCVMHSHTMSDVRKIRSVVPAGKLLVRINPVYCGTQEEVKQVVDSGADVIMLPMWKTMQEVEMFLSCVSGRTRVCLLAETPEGLACLPQLCQVPEVDEFHIGLNDLSIALNKKFLFETLADGLVEEATQCLRDNNKTFGIGGIARIKEGLVPPEVLLGEHVRLGSVAAILSRTFDRNIQTLDALKKEMNFSEQVSMLKRIYRDYQHQSLEELYANQMLFKRLVKNVVKSIER